MHFLLSHYEGPKINNEGTSHFSFVTYSKNQSFIVLAALYSGFCKGTVYFYHVSSMRLMALHHNQIKGQ